MMEHEPEGIELNRSLNPEGGTRIPQRWEHAYIEKQNLILIGGSPMGILPHHTVEVMPVKAGDDVQAEVRSLLE